MIILKEPTIKEKIRSVQELTRLHSEYEFKSELESKYDSELLNVSTHAKHFTINMARVVIYK